MKRIWGFIATLFIGFSAGLIAMYKLMGDKVEVNIKRIKTKRGSSEVNLNLDVDSPQKRLKRTKEQRKADRDERRSK